MGYETSPLRTIDTDAVMLVALADIDVGERMRPVDADWAQALAGILAVEPQRTPIEICRLPGASRWTLVTGAHRLAALSLNGAATIRAVEVGNGRAERRMAEISENLWRRDLDPIDRAAFFAELHDLLRARAGVAADAPASVVAANARWQRVVKEDAADASVIVTDAYGWTDQIAASAGISRSAVERDLTLHRRLLPGVAALLRGRAIGRNATQLRALAKLDPARQAEVAALLAMGTKSVADALATMGQKRAVDPATKRYSAVIGTLARMGTTERQAVLDDIAGRYTHSCRAALAKTGGGS